MQEDNKLLIALSKMSLGQKALVVAFSFDTTEGQRVQDLGLVPGEMLEIVRVPPQGEPIEIKIRGYFVALKKEEADHIMVKPFF